MKEALTFVLVYVGSVVLAIGVLAVLFEFVHLICWLKDKWRGS